MEERRGRRGRPHIGKKVFCKLLRSKWALSLIICTSFWNETLWLQLFSKTKLKTVKKIQLCSERVCQDFFMLKNGKNWSEIWVAEIPMLGSPVWPLRREVGFLGWWWANPWGLWPDKSVIKFSILKRERKVAILRDRVWIFWCLSGNSLSWPINCLIMFNIVVKRTRSRVA